MASRMKRALTPQEIKELIRIQTYLDKTFPDCCVMPSTKKIPKRHHKDIPYTSEMFLTDVLSEDYYNCNEGAVILLGDSLIVVDVDTHEWCETLEHDYPDIFPKTVSCKGEHGKHYYFIRTPEAQNLSDGPRSLKDKGVTIPIDIKTRCKTGTRGVIEIPRYIMTKEEQDTFKGEKRWIHPIGKHPILPFPMDFYNKYAQTNTRQTRRNMSSTDELPAVVTHPIVTLNTNYITKLLSLLSKTRWDERNQWRDIAIALQNSYPDAEEETYDLWIQFSKISYKFDKTEANKLWTSCADPNYQGAKLTIKTIELWASQDDPLGYQALKAATIANDIEYKILQDEDRGLGEVAGMLMKDYIKKTQKGSFVYYFEPTSVCWKKVEYTNVRMPISKRIEEELNKLSIKLTQQIQMTNQALHADPSDDQKTKLEKELESLIEKRVKVQGKIKYVKTNSGYNRVANIAAEMLSDDTFEQKLDSVPYLLGVKNGVIDLRTGELRNRVPEDYIYNILDIEYDSSASTEFVESVVLSIMADDPVMAKYLQKLLGYGITGEVKEQIFPVFTSSGRSGKGLITQMLQNILGSFYGEMNCGLIVDRQVSNVDAERHKLLGSRIAVFNELRPNEKLKTNEVQLLSGGDQIPCKALYQDPISISPRHLCILVTNHMPTVTEVIPAIMERLQCIHFPVTFMDLPEGTQPTANIKQRDNDLKDKLLANKTGFLKWLVDGAVEWYKTQDLKRNAPPQVKEFGNSYFEEQDVLACFIKEMCDVTDPNAKVRTSDFLEAFNHWSTERQHDPKTLAAAMKTKGFDKDKGRLNGKPEWVFKRIKLKNDGCLF